MYKHAILLKNIIKKYNYLFTPLNVTPPKMKI